MAPFVPLFRNGHLATIASNFWPRQKELAHFDVRPVRYETEPDVAVLVLEQRPPGRARGEIVLVHGLEGSAEGGYMRSMAYAALTAGYAVHRMNIRGCGGTEDWCRTLYHAGLTSDLRYVVGQVASRAEGPVTVIGYSLGGNMTLKLTGEGSPHDLAIAVSTPIDLAECVRALARPGNQLYERRFVASMKNRLAERARLHPREFAPLAARFDEKRVRTIFDFDNEITAPFFGFGTAPQYYGSQSAVNFLGSIATPTLLVTAQDDPLVPFPIYGHPAIAANPHLETLTPAHGGHVGFLARSGGRFWLDQTLLNWIEKRRNKS